jgi:phenylacetate-CoA ligase
MIPLVSRAIYRLQEAALQRPTFGLLREIEQSQHVCRADIEALQAKMLNRLLALALSNSPWHAERIRSAGLEQAIAAGSVTASDLRKLPTMSKRDARDNVERIVWRATPGGVYKYNTGGSSGEPLIFYFGRDRQASDAAGRMRARRWWGVDPGDREVYLWGAPVELVKTDRVKTIRDRLLNQLVLNAFAMSAANMDAYARAINEFRPKCIYGYASSVALLAAHARTRGLKLALPELRVVCTTGEPLYPVQRALIGEVFGAPVANEYGSRDIGFTAHEAPTGQMLLMSESILLEVLGPDGRPVPAGAVGEAVMTGLRSNAQPFIRYRTGDMVRVSGAQDGSGCGLHVIDEVVGRKTDFVVCGDGTVMHALAVIYVLRAVEGIAEFKFIQHSVREVEVLIVPDDRWSESGRKRVVDGLQARLGHDAQIDLRLVEAIAPEASGKHRYVVSHVPVPSGKAIAPDPVTI